MFSPLEKPSVVKWAETSLYLPPQITERSGIFSTESCAYMREPLECFRDAAVQEMDLVWGTQTGKTTCQMVGLAYTVDCNPRRSMLAFPTDAIARRFSKARWLPLVKNADVLSRHKPESADDITTLDQSFDSCSVFFTGVGSASKVSSEPIALLLEDEIDKFPPATEKEADARSLLEERTKSFIYKLIVRSSTPTVESGNISVSYAQSDRRKYFVPCPHCGALIDFEFKYLHWYRREDDGEDWDIARVRETALYYCQECGRPITDAQRLRCIEQGQWQPTNSAAVVGHRGYHLSSLYAPTLCWGDIAAKFCAANNSRKTDELQNFVNSWLAEPWEEETHNSDPELLSACARDYNRGELKGKVRVITVDVQRRDLRFNVRGYDESGSYLLDWGTLTSFEDVAAMQEKYSASYVGIDINYRDREQEVYDAIYPRRFDGWLAIVGAPDKQQTRPFVESAFNAFTGKKKYIKFTTGAIKQLTVKSGLYKGEIARRRSGTASNWYVYRFIERGYVRELFAEVQAEKYERGRRVNYWKQLRADNHQFDLECYQLAIADWAKLHRHGAIQFSPRIADIVQPAAPKPPSENPAPAQPTDAATQPARRRPTRRHRPTRNRKITRQ